MRPHRFRPWAEEQFRQSPAIASVEAVRDDRPGHEHITYTHINLATGARIIVMWVGGAPPGGDPPGSEEKIVTGLPPEPVKVPELSTSGRLRTADIEAHLVALLNNGGHEEVAEVRRSSQQPTIYTEGPTPGIRVRCHSGATVTGIFLHTLSRGQQPTAQTEHKPREEV